MYSTKVTAKEAGSSLCQRVWKVWRKEKIAVEEDATAAIKTCSWFEGLEETHTVLAGARLCA